MLQIFLIDHTYLPVGTWETPMKNIKTKNTAVKAAPTEES